MNIPTDLIRIKEASAMLNLKEGTIYNHVCRWTLPFVKKGRELWFSKSELMDYIRERKKKEH